MSLLSVVNAAIPKLITSLCRDSTTSRAFNFFPLIKVPFVL